MSYAANNATDLESIPILAAALDIKIGKAEPAKSASAPETRAAVAFLGKLLTADGKLVDPNFDQKDLTAILNARSDGELQALAEVCEALHSGPQAGLALAMVENEVELIQLGRQYLI